MFIVRRVRVSRRYFSFRQWTSPTYRMLGLGIMSGIVAQLVFYLFDHFYSDLRIQLLWTFIGLLMALLRIEQSNFRLRAARSAPERIAAQGTTL